MRNSYEGILKQFHELANKDPQLQQIRYQILCDEMYRLTGDVNLIDNSIPLGSRTAMAQQLCIKELNRKKLGFQITPKQESYKIQTVNDIQAVLRDETLAPEELQVLLDATYYIHDAEDSLNPDDIAEELRQMHADGQKYATRKSESGKERTFEEDLREERKKRTEQFLADEQERLEKKRSSEKSNTKGDLRAFEQNIRGLRKNMQDKENRGRYFAVLSDNNMSVQSNIAVGAGRDLFLNPSKFAKSHLAQKLIANGIMKSATNSLMSKGITAALGTALGPLAPLASMILGQIGAKKALQGIGVLLGAGVLGVFLLPVALVGLVVGLIGAVATAFGAITGAAIFGAVIGISLITFIINSGGYMVPPTNGLSVSEANLCLDPKGKSSTFPAVEGSMCPIPDGRVSCGSYGEPGGACPATCGRAPNQVTGASGHGGNCYWAGQAPLPACNYAIPTIDTRAEPGGATGAFYCSHTSADKNSICYRSNSQCGYYGYAADMTYRNLRQLSANSCLPVYLPFLEGQSVSWTLGERYHGFLADRGGYGILRTQYKGKTWELYMIHLNQQPIGGQSGEPAGTLFDVFNRSRGDGRHVHLELRVNGKYYKPDFFCGGSTPIP